MSKPGDKDWLPRDEYLRRIPKKRISAGVIFFNQQNQILLVKPSYKEGWTIPAGSVDQYESPRDCAVRETLEEIGVQTENPTFIGVVHSPRPDSNDDVMHFFYYGGILPNNTKIILQADELTEYRFVPVSDVHEYVIKPFADLFPMILESIKDNRPFSVQEEPNKS